VALERAPGWRRRGTGAGCGEDGGFAFLVAAMRALMETCRRLPFLVFLQGLRCHSNHAFGSAASEHHTHGSGAKSRLQRTAGRLRGGFGARAVLWCASPSLQLKRAREKTWQPFCLHKCRVPWLRAPPASLTCVPFSFPRGDSSSRAGLGSVLAPVPAIAARRVSPAGSPRLPGSLERPLVGELRRPAASPS